MNVKAINFCGKYQLNANQQMPNQESCLKRDALIGFWTANAKDGNKVAEQLKDFYTGVAYKQNPNANLDIVLNIPDKLDKDFQDSMNAVGQKFTQIA